ncbi:MAG: recombination protein RecR [Saprospiraceae bacterium]|nr:recombination protein RecR [Saprospiraceae bacterium]MBK9993384.1 recombination protein RecR [Saprospiraceae bacterium]
MGKVGSKLLFEAVELFSGLPGIGKKSALRMALHVAAQDPSKTKKLSDLLSKITTELKVCKHCFLYADTDICDICASSARDTKTLCIVESIKDVLAIEETSQYNGKYHILGALISPIDGIGPDSLNLNSLADRIVSNGVTELIMAIRPSIEGDTTIYYISKLLTGQNVKISMIARGVSFGSELEFTDEITLGRSILSRTPYLIHENQLV